MNNESDRPAKPNARLQTAEYEGKDDAADTGSSSRLKLLVQAQGQDAAKQHVSE